MRFALSTGSLYTYGIERVFGLAAEVGFDGLEVLVDVRFDTRQPAYLQRLVQRHGIVLNGCPPGPRTTPGASPEQPNWPPQWGRTLSSPTCLSGATAPTPAGYAGTWLPGSAPTPARLSRSRTCR